MDYKLKRIVILLASLAVLAVLFIVLLANRQNMVKRPATTTASVASASQSASSYNGNLYAWKNDETFFNHDKDSFAARIMDDMKTLSVRAVSTEKDLRIQVLDYEGNLSVGNAFDISVKKAGSTDTSYYQDADKDGILYLDDIPAGNYEIFLAPIEGYIVPSAPVSVRVPEKVEKKLIEDISLALCEESDIEKNADDLMKVSATADADKKQVTTYKGDSKYGIDITGDYGEVDWVKVYDSGIRFVMLRAGYRGASSGKLIKDPNFAINALNARRAGLDVGAYFFSQAVNEREAVEEASALFVLSSGLNLSYPLCIRIDGAGGNGRADDLSEEERTSLAEAFCLTLRNSGVEPFVYASHKWLNNKLVTKRLEKYGIWLSEYHKTPTYEGYFDMWQYSGKGKVPGIQGEVGLNISYLKESD